MKTTRLVFLLASSLFFLLVGCSLPSNRTKNLIPVTGLQALQGTPNSLTASPPAFLGEDNTPAPPEPEATQPAATDLPPIGPVITVPAAGEPTVLPSLTPSMLPTESLPTPASSPSPSGIPSPLGSPTPTATPLSFFTPTMQVTAAAPGAAPGTEVSSLLGREQLFTQLADSQVRNLSQGVIGEMRGMVFDSLNGLPLYAVVAPGQGTTNRLAGARRVLVPVPWGALNLAGLGIYQPQAGVLLLPVEDHVLSTAPSFDERMWEGKQPPHDWDMGIHDYWVNFVPMAPGSSRVGPGQVVMVSGAPFWLDKTQLRRRGIDVTGSGGETIGRLKDLVLDANGVVRYAVVLVDDILGLGGRLAPVPWNNLVWSPGGWLILQGPPALLQSAPGYTTRAAFPDLSQPEWDREIRGYWVK